MAEFLPHYVYNKNFHFILISAMTTIVSPEDTMRNQTPTKLGSNSCVELQNKPLERIAFIDVVPSSLFITPATDQRLRECAKKVANLLGYNTTHVSFPQCPDESTKKNKRHSPGNHCPHTQVYSNPQWWKYLPKVCDLRINLIYSFAMKMKMITMIPLLSSAPGSLFLS